MCGCVVCVVWGVVWLGVWVCDVWCVGGGCAVFVVCGVCCVAVVVWCLLCLWYVVVCVCGLYAVCLCVCLCVLCVAMSSFV